MADSKAGRLLLIAQALLDNLIPEKERQREGLVDTPARFSNAWCEWTAGYDIDPAALLKSFVDGGEGYDSLVIQCGIPVYSHCEHHLAPFWGEAHIGYLPNGKIVGLSKLAQLVNAYARRLQVQERMTQQIADALFENVHPHGVGVILRCRHMCIESRGVRTPGTTTITSALRGTFASDGDIRSEFLSLRTHSKGVI